LNGTEIKGAIQKNVKTFDLGADPAIPRSRVCFFSFPIEKAQPLCDQIEIKSEEIPASKHQTFQKTALIYSRPHKLDRERNA